jgi:5-methylcytosine-specific restriction endonuclease McrA
MKERNQTLRKRVFERDNFTCQKCKIQDKTTRILEAHHIIPLFVEGNDDLNNLITLCSDCHHFAPDNKEEFDKYMQEEMEGTLTTLMKAWNQFRVD